MVVQNNGCCTVIDTEHFSDGIFYSSSISVLTVIVIDSNGQHILTTYGEVLIIVYGQRKRVRSLNQRIWSDLNLHAFLAPIGRVERNGVQW